MSTSILTLEDAVDVFVDPELTLFGIRCIPITVGQEVPSGTEVQVDALGMFSLWNGAASLRTRISVDVEMFQEIWIDVAATFSAPERYTIQKDLFLKFANDIALPQLRSYAQALLDPLLIAAGYPARILPPFSGLEQQVFRGDSLPDELGPDVMEKLKEVEELQVPEVAEFQDPD